MQTVLDELKKGNASIPRYFEAAEHIWSDILVFVDNLTAEELAEKLHDSQRRFERECGGNPLGETVMGWSGFAHFYSKMNAFEDNGPRAYKLSEAFKKSGGSLEVKHAAKKAAELYGVDDYAS